MDSSTSTIRRPCFVEEDDGLASIADVEAGFSGNQNHFISRPLYHTSAFSRKSSIRNLSSSPYYSSRSARYFDGRFEEHQPHFLDACFLCKKQLGDNKDIFMYRGDTPFCSEECRQEQIEKDEAKEKNWNLSASMKALRKKDQNKSASSNKTAKAYAFQSGAVAAA